MKAEIKQEQAKYINIIDIADDVFINQALNCIMVEKSKLPDLIKILQSFVES